MKKKFFRMLRNLTKAWLYLCFQRHRRINLNAYLNIPVKVSFFWKGIQQSGLVIEMMDQKNSKGLERIEILITFYMKVFLAVNIIAIYMLLEMQR